MSSPTLSADVVLSRAAYLTRKELLKRRLRHLRQLSRCYRRHYWALMESLRLQHRKYYWKFGVSPFKQNPADDAQVIESCPADNPHVNNQHCLFVGCKFKAMALTRFCQLHILSDSKQKLYKACNYVIKSAHAGPITCGKPILRSAIPSLCTVHLQKTRKDVNRALKKANLNVSSSSKLASMFHVIVAEYVHQIQAKRRRAALRGITNKATIKEECAS